MWKFLSSLVFLTQVLVAGEASDPFRWLEEESQQQTQWLSEQSERTERYFAQHSTRATIKNRLSEIATFERTSLPERRGKTLYYLKQRTGENKALLIKQNSDQEEVLVDPNQSKEETSLIGFTVSSDGKYLAYGLSLAGSDQDVWHLYDLDKHQLLPDTLKEIQFSKVEWNASGDAVFYIRNCHELFRHQLGSSTEEDLLLFTASEGQLIFEPKYIVDGDYVLVMERPWVVNNNSFLRIDARGQPIKLITGSEAEVTYVGENKGKLFFITDENCCYGKLISLGPEGKQTVIDEKERLLQDAVLIDDYLVCAYYHQAIAELMVYDLQGNFIKEISLPGKGSVGLSSSSDASCLYYSYTDFATPDTLFAYNVKTDTQSLVFAPKLHFDSSQYVTTQMRYWSTDQVSIPLFLTHRKGMQITENTPVLLYGYGGFGVSVTPHFNSAFLAWMEAGGVLAVPSLRGGKEFGTQWYMMGKGHHKLNVFEDCLAAAEFLARSHIGSPKTFALMGTSNGGLLAGTCLTMRPDLFSAVIVNKGVLDMLRFHLFTMGKHWICDYGNPENPTDYAYLLSYSPYHQIKKETHYPAVLVNTADHDDRVVPLHSFKFAAALLEANVSKNPILLRLEKACGHSGRSSFSQEISFGTDCLSFLFNELRNYIAKSLP